MDISFAKPVGVGAPRPTGASNTPRPSGTSAFVRPSQASQDLLKHQRAIQGARTLSGRAAKREEIAQAPALAAQKLADEK